MLLYLLISTKEPLTQLWVPRISATKWLGWKQSGKSTKVLSSYTYISKDKEISRTVCSEVLFNPLSEAEIIEYIEKFQPFDKAGSYGIQDDYPLINRIEGSYYNVMGLPVEDLAEHVFKR